jgi:hypothetical protein
MGLIELIIYSALSLLVLAAVGGLVVTLLHVQQEVVNGSKSAQESQLIAQNVEHGIRNSTAFMVTDLLDGRQFLQARTAGASNSITWMCAAWLFDPANGGVVRTKQAPVAISLPTQAQASNWALLGEGVSASGSGGIFSTSGQTLTLTFRTSVADEPPVNLQASVSARAGQAVSSPCF